MRKILILSVLALLIGAMSVAGCLNQSKPQQVDYTNLTHNATVATPVVKTVVVPGPTVYVTPTPTPPTPTPIPPTQSYEVQVGGSVYNHTGYFYATVTNGVGVYQNLNNQIDWFINGAPAGGVWDSYGSLQIHLTPGVQYTITATYVTQAPVGQFGTPIATSGPYYVTG